MPTVSLKLPDDLHEELESHCRVSGLGKSEVIRRALRGSLGLPAVATITRPLPDLPPLSVEEVIAQEATVGVLHNTTATEVVVNASGGGAARKDAPPVRPVLDTPVPSPAGTTTKSVAHPFKCQNCGKGFPTSIGRCPVDVGRKVPV